MLESEGFRFRGFVDIFDAGPTVEAEVCNLNSVRNSKVVTVVVKEQVPEVEAAVPHIVCNTQLKTFEPPNCCCEGADELILDNEQAEKMHLSDGDDVRVVAL